MLYQHWPWLTALTQGWTKPVVQGSWSIPAWQDYLNAVLILRNRMYFRPCMTGSPQYCINTVIQGEFLMLDDRINSVLHWYWGTGYIFDPVRQVHLSIVPILWYRVNFWCCMTGLPQCCIDTEKQDIFMTLHNRFNSVLHQYCHTG